MKLPTPVVISSPQKVKKRGLGVGRIQNGHCQHLGPDFSKHHKGSFIFIFKQKNIFAKKPLKLPDLTVPTYIPK